MIVGMTSFHSAEQAAEHVAAEVRAHMARQRKFTSDLAGVLNMTRETAKRRLDGSVPFDVVELTIVADWLGVEATSLMPGTVAGAATA